MSDADFSELIDKAMAGKLTPEEESRWNALLAERTELEEDLAVGRALQALPPPPAVSSNFTARVLEAVRLGERAGDRKGRRGWEGWWRWPRLARVSAIAAVAVFLAFTGLELRERHEVKAEARTFMVGVSKVADRGKEAAPEVVVAVFQDFDAIRNLPERSEGVDYDLLKALTK